MESPSPLYILINSSQAIMDLCFWDTTFFPVGSKLSSIWNKPQMNSFIIAGYGDNGGVDLWDLVTHRVVKNLPSKHGVVSVFGTQQGEVVYLNKEGDFRMYSIASSEPKLSLQISNVGFCKMSCLNDKNRLFCATTGHQDSSLLVWDLRKEEVMSLLCIKENVKLGMVMVIQLFETGCPASLLCLGAYESGCLVLWDVKNQASLHRLEIFKMEPIMCLDFVTSQMCGVAGSPSDSLKKFSITADTDGQYVLHIVKIRSMLNPGVSDVKIRPDCKIVVAGGWHDGSVRVFSLKSLRPLAVLSYHSGTVQCIAFKNDIDSRNQLLASGSLTNKIAVWKIYND